MDVLVEDARFVYNLIHRDSHMTFFIDAFAVADQQYLRGFVTDIKGVGDLVGDGPVVDEVEVVEVDGVGSLIPFQPVLDQGAGGATDTVFEN